MTWDSGDRLQVRLHYTLNSTDAGETGKILVAAIATGEVPEGFHSHVDAHLVSVLETVGYGLGCTVDMNRHSFNDMRFDPLGERHTGKSGDPQPRIFQTGKTRLTRQGNPHFRGLLGCQIVKTQCCQQADHCIRDTRTNLGNGVVFGDAMPCGYIETTCFALDKPFFEKPIKSNSRQAESFKVSRAHDAPSLYNGQDLLLALGYRHENMIQYVVLCLQLPTYCIMNDPLLSHSLFHRLAGRKEGQISL